MEKEIWKDIPNYEGYYQASSLGRIKSLERIVPHPHSGYLTIKEKIRKTHEDSWGYLSINLNSNGTKTSYKVHQLIAICFLNHKKSGMEFQVDHINNDKKDNRASNLRILTAREHSHITHSRNKNMASKYIGVRKGCDRDRWVASIKINNKSYHLGWYKLEINAHKKYQEILLYLNSNGEQATIDFILSKRKPQSSKHKNIHFDAETNKWRVNVVVNKEKHYVGRFKTESEALLARNKFLKERES